MNFKVLYLSLCVILFFSCKKEEKIDIGLEYYENMVSNDHAISLVEAVKPIYIEKSYIIDARNNINNYAYPEYVRIDDNNLMMIVKSSIANIEDSAKADLIKLYSKDSGLTWRTSDYLSKIFPNSINSSMPSVVRLGKNHLLLIYSVKFNSSRIDIYSEESFNNGTTWSEPKIVFGDNQGYQILNNSRAILHGNRIIIPISIPQNGSWNSYLTKKGAIVVFYYYSDDKGKTWNKSKALSSEVDLLEPGIVSLSNNEMLMNIRTDYGRVLFARTTNNGNTWTFEKSNIKSPSSPQSIKRIPNTDSLLMVWNDTEFNASTHGGNRVPLSIAVSTDKGYSWKKIADVEPFNGYTIDYAYATFTFDSKFIYIIYNERQNSTSSFAIKLAKIKRGDL